MNAVFFSILLPTKNRSHLLSAAIDSVLGQSYSNFELIVSDNDDDPDAVLAVIKQYNDPRIIYLRTNGELSMPANWQNALNNSCGQFITVLQDKQIYYPDALKIANEALVSSRAKVLTWRVNATTMFGGLEYVSKDTGADILWHEKSESILFEFTNYGCFRVWDRLPRLINSCVSRDVIHQAQAGEKRFFNDVTPDLSASFIQLALVDEIYHLNRSLVISTSNHLSGGVAVRRRQECGKKFLTEVDSVRKVCGHVEVQNPHIVTNLILDDYIEIQRLFGGNLTLFNVERANYFKFLVCDVARNVVETNIVMDDIVSIINKLKNMNFVSRISICSHFLLAFVKFLFFKFRNILYFLIYRTTKFVAL